MEIRIYHNNRCGNCRKALQILQDHGLQPTIRYYLAEVPDKKELEDLLAKLVTDPQELIRTKEEEYKAHYGQQILDRETILEALLRFPVLLQRPVVVLGDHAMIARPPEKLIPFLEEKGLRG